MNNIPFAKLYDAIEPLYDEYMAKIGEMVKNCEFIGGKEVELFEKEFALWAESKYAVGTANGTDSIIIALRALGIGPGDTVLVPDHTFIATAEAVTMVGANADFIDIERDYYTIDPQKIVEYLESPKGKSVKAIIPVHIYGQMANMPVIAEIAKKYHLYIIEDAAQAHGAKINGYHPGYFGDVATYSFYPGKNIGAFGDAGAITTNDENLYKKCKMLVNHGRWKAKYAHNIEGYNMRLDSIQATVLRIKLKHIDEWTKLRKQKARIYLDELEQLNGIKLPKIRDSAEHVWHIFSILIERRDEVKEKIELQGIECGIHYPIPLHLQKAYEYKAYKEGDFSITEEIAKHQLSLPFWPEIKEEEIVKIKDILQGSIIRSI